MFFLTNSIYFLQICVYSDASNLLQTWWDKQKTRKVATKLPEICKNWTFLYVATYLGYFLFLFCHIAVLMLCFTLNKT